MVSTVYQVAPILPVMRVLAAAVQGVAYSTTLATALVVRAYSGRVLVELPIFPLLAVAVVVVAPTEQGGTVVITVQAALAITVEVWGGTAALAQSESSGPETFANSHQPAPQTNKD